MIGEDNQRCCQGQPFFVVVENRNNLGDYELICQIMNPQSVTDVGAKDISFLVENIKRIQQIMKHNLPDYDWRPTPVLETTCYFLVEIRKIVWQIMTDCQRLLLTPKPETTSYF